MPTLHWLKARWKDSPPVFLLVSLLVGLLVFFSVIAFSEDPKWAFYLFGIENKYQILKSLGIAMGGVLLAIQAVTAHRRAKAMEETARAQVNATEEQAKTNENAEKGLRQERLKNAIEHMGHKSDSVRLGGAYELFHLAEDNQELRGTVLDVLCAHVRRTTRESKYPKAYLAEPSEEIQTLLTLLFVQEHDVFQGLHINLAGSWLNGAYLLKARLGGANLLGARLQGAYLKEARLQGAVLGVAHLQGASLNQAQLQGASLWRAQLQRADLVRAQLQGAALNQAQLQGAVLGGAQLQGASLMWAQLQGAASETICIPDGFARRMRSLVGRESDLSGVIFEGGLMMKDMVSILEGLSAEKAQELRERLEPHIDKPPIYGLPKDSGAETGAYTPEQAEAWIKEYEEAISESPTPETDDKGGR